MFFIYCIFNNLSHNGTIQIQQQKNRSICIKRHDSIRASVKLHVQGAI